VISLSVCMCVCLSVCGKLPFSYQNHNHGHIALFSACIGSTGYLKTGMEFDVSDCLVYFVNYQVLAEANTLFCYVCCMVVEL